MATTKMRESSFELIRLMAMFMIVLYHTYFFHIQPAYDTPFNTAVWMPLHIGVPLFVLISGYWGIRISGRGLARLLGQMLVYTVPLMLIFNHLTGTEGGKSTVIAFLFVSNTPFWFMKIYICLYLISPVLNYFLKDISPKNRLYLLLALFITAIYMPTAARLTAGTPDEGKNLLYFAFVYVLGDTVRAYQSAWRKIRASRLLFAFLLLNIFLVAVYCLFDGDKLSAKLFYLCFPYNSPILQLNAVLLFMLVAKHPFKSKAVNWLSSSALAIYLIHESYIVRYWVIGPVALWIKSFFPNDYVALCALAVLALGVVLACILIDKLFTPLWAWFQRVGEKAEIKIVAFVNQHV